MIASSIIRRHSVSLGVGLVLGALAAAVGDIAIVVARSKDGFEVSWAAWRRALEQGGVLSSASIGALAGLAVAAALGVGLRRWSTFRHVSDVERVLQLRVLATVPRNATRAERSARR